MSSSRLQGQVRIGGGVSSLHSGIEFGRRRTGEGSSGGKKKGVVVMMMCCLLVLDSVTSTPQCICQPRPSVYLKEGMYHTSLFRGSSTNQNEVKKQPPPNSTCPCRQELDIDDYTDPIQCAK